MYLQSGPSKTIKISNKEYILQKVLGQGSFGKVYLASSAGDSQQYAIKEQNQISEEEFDFSRIMTTKKFKNLVNVFAIEKLNRKIYIVMEYCSISLYDRIQQKTFDASQMRFVMKQIANGIKELHDMNIAHRDLKPENLLIQIIPLGNDQVQEIYKICDFGTIKEQDRLQTKQVGTPYYLAPEQLSGNENYTLKADIWSFGAVCYELLTNKPLFDGMTIQEIERKIKNLKIEDEISKLKNMERRHIELLKMMLNRDPNQRCSIDQVIANLTVQTKSVNRVDPKVEIKTKQQPSLTMQPIQSKQFAEIAQYKQQTLQQQPEQNTRNTKVSNQFQQGVTLQKNTEQIVENDFQVRKTVTNDNSQPPVDVKNPHACPQPPPFQQSQVFQEYKNKPPQLNFQQIQQQYGQQSNAQTFKMVSRVEEQKPPIQAKNSIYPGNNEVYKQQSNIPSQFQQNQAPFQQQNQQQPNNFSKNQGQPSQLIKRDSFGEKNPPKQLIPPSSIQNQNLNLSQNMCQKPSQFIPGGSANTRTTVSQAIGQPSRGRACDFQQNSVSGGQKLQFLSPQIPKFVPTQNQAQQQN